METGCATHRSQIFATNRPLVKNITKHREETSPGDLRPRQTPDTFTVSPVVEKNVTILTIKTLAALSSCVITSGAPTAAIIVPLQWRARRSALWELSGRQAGSSLRLQRGAPTRERGPAEGHNTHYCTTNYPLPNHSGQIPHNALLHPPHSVLFLYCATV